MNGGEPKLLNSQRHHRRHRKLPAIAERLEDRSLLTAPTAFGDFFETSHDHALTVNANGVLSNDYSSADDTITVIRVDDVSNGTLALNADGSFTYTPTSGFAGVDGFTYKVSNGIEDSNTATVTLNVTNIVPSAVDDDFDFPEPGVQYVDIDVLGNDLDMDDDHTDLVITSVSTPTFGGTASIVGNKIRYYPPSDYYSNVDPEVDIFSLGTEFTYTVADPVGLADPLQPVGQGTVKANPKKPGPWREYSRGNDDRREAIYETGIVKVELVIDDSNRKVTLKYTATATTDSRIRLGTNGQPESVQPGDAIQGDPEYEFFQGNLFLQKSEVVLVPTTGGGFVPVSVPPAAEGVNLGFAAGGVGGVLSGEIELGTWTNANISGTAVIQMRVPVRNGSIIFGPPAAGDTWYYYRVRQRITWGVDVVAKNGVFESRKPSLSVRELPFGAFGAGINGAPDGTAFTGNIATPLRIINSSERESDVFKLGYPAKAAGRARKDFVPDIPGIDATLGAQDDPSTPGDQRGEFITPPADWGVMVKAKTK